MMTITLMNTWNEDEPKRYRTLWRNEEDGSYYLCSSVVDTDDSLFEDVGLGLVDETMVFPADDQGKVLSWSEMAEVKPALWKQAEHENMVRRIVEESGCSKIEL